MADIVDWGPAAWTYLHAVTYSFPDMPTAQDMAHYRRFFELVGTTLPCASCSEHYNAYIITHPPATSSRKDLVRWLIDVHNAVRHRQNKTTLTYGEATRDILGGAARRRRTAVVVASVLVAAAIVIVVVGIVLAVTGPPC